MKFVILSIICSILFFSSCSNGKGKNTKNLYCKSDNECSLQSEICSSGVCKIPECKQKSDCPENYSCLQGVCNISQCLADDECPIISTCYDGFCTHFRLSCRDYDCPPELTCAVDKRCYSENESIPCKKQTDCKDGVCVQNYCTKKMCTTIKDCPAYSFCEDKSCKTIECDTSCEDSPCLNFSCKRSYLCSSGHDCPLTNLCFEGKCLIPCEKSSDCPGPAICIDKKCQMKKCLEKKDCGDGNCIENICVKTDS